MEWFGAMGLMITLVWLYIEFLRLFLNYQVKTDLINNVKKKAFYYERPLISMLLFKSYKVRYTFTIKYRIAFYQTH
jgi:hypothetical protein